MNFPKTLFALVAAGAPRVRRRGLWRRRRVQLERHADAPSGLSGSITIDGSSTVQPFAEAAAELFGEGSPDLQVTVGAAGTSGGFEKFCADETDISDASRAIEPEEEELCKEGGVEYDRDPGGQRRDRRSSPIPASRSPA